MDKLMFIGFYHAGNKEYYGRDAFRHCAGKDTYKMLHSLPEEDRKIYLMTERDWRLSDAEQFVWDYNEELLTGEHWCVVFYMTREEYREVLFEIVDKEIA